MAIFFPLKKQKKYVKRQLFAKVENKHETDFKTTK